MRMGSGGWVLWAVVGIAVATSVVIGVGMGCVGSEANAEHCWNASGDATCNQAMGPGTWYCTTDAAPCWGACDPRVCVGAAGAR